MKRSKGATDGMKSPAITAALTLSLTGQYERQGTEAAEGVRLWAQEADIRLILADDHGSRSMAVEAYAGWIDGVDLLLGPYASGLVRAVAPLVRDAGRILWNHGASADDLAQPGTASLPAPASTYFEGIVAEAIERKVRRLILVQGPGPFARYVANGAKARGAERGIDSQTVDASAVESEDLEETALLVAGPFEHDVAVVAASATAPNPPCSLVPWVRESQHSARNSERPPKACWRRCSGGQAHRHRRSARPARTSPPNTSTEQAMSLRIPPPKLPPPGILLMAPIGST